MPQATAISIRPILASDAAPWRDLWTAYLTFYETTLPAPVYDATFARILSGTAGIHGLIAERDGVALGLVHYIVHPTCWKIEPVCYLQDLFTTPAARGQGVARALIEAVYARADAMGAPAVYWMTAETNYKGRMLYDKIGVKTPFIKYARRG
ncbi:MAG: GNAT family N-acetyltransferase [Paracoccaceae bacterium]|nr:GNAT family N-acetyltransferase [Paracoccaceae bacterium]